jgi:hypothetical protein
VRERQITERTANAGPMIVITDANTQPDGVVSDFKRVCGRRDQRHVACCNDEADEAGDESARPIHDQVMMVAQSWNERGRPVLVKSKTGGRRTVER